MDLETELIDFLIWIDKNDKNSLVENGNLTELAKEYMCENKYIDLDKIEKEIDNLLKQDLIIYEFCYNDSCYECSPLVVSIHLTKKGAEMALDYHKENEKKEHLESYGENYEFKYDFDKWWGIRETKILK